MVEATHGAGRSRHFPNLRHSDRTLSATPMNETPDKVRTSPPSAPVASAGANKLRRGYDPNVGAVSLLHWLRRGIPPLLGFATIALAWMELQGFDLAALRASVRQVPVATLLGLEALALAAVFEMVLYDWWLSRRLKVAVPLARLMRYSWVANTTNNLIGLSGLAGSGIRILLLSRDGVPARTAALYAGIVMLSVPVGLSVAR